MKKDRLTADVTSARHGRLRRSVGWMNAAKVLLAAVLTIAISGVAVGAYAVLNVVQGAKTVDLGGASDIDAIGAQQQSLEGELTILLVGSDKRDPDSPLNDGEEGELNDVNMLLHIPADHQSATVITFPRDLMVPIPSCTDPETGDVYSAMSEQQINTAIMYGGLGCVAATISKLTGMPIPYAAMVDFDGVIDITNAIGGVTVCLANPIYDHNAGLNLPAGEVTVSGVQAINFVRTRYGIGNGSDLNRISNQQVYMSALLRQMRSAKTLSNPVTVYKLAKAGFNNLTLSSNMASLEFFQALAATVVDIDLSRVNFVQYPTFWHPDDPNRLAPDRESGDQLISVVLSGEAFEVAKLGGGAVAQSDAGGEEGAAPSGGDGAPVTVLPGTITGQSAANETCSAGSGGEQ